MHLLEGVRFAVGISKQLGCWLSSMPAGFRQVGGGVTPWNSCRMNVQYPHLCTQTHGEREEVSVAALDAFVEAQEDPSNTEAIT